MRLKETIECCSSIQNVSRVKETLGWCLIQLVPFHKICYQSKNQVEKKNKDFSFQVPKMETEQHNKTIKNAYTFMCYFLNNSITHYWNIFITFLISFFFSYILLNQYISTSKEKKYAIFEQCVTLIDRQYLQKTLSCPLVLVFAPNGILMGVNF